MIKEHQSENIAALLVGQHAHALRPMKDTNELTSLISTPKFIDPGDLVCYHCEDAMLTFLHELYK